MKKRLTLVLSMLLALCAVFMVACDNKKPDDGDGTTPATTASYTTEYWLENDDGTYAKSDTHGETLTGNVGETVKITQKEIDGYYFDGDNKSNVLRGSVLEDGSLVLKAYYGKDYSGRVTFQTTLGDEIDLLKGTKTTLAVTVLLDGTPLTSGVTYASSDRYVEIDAVTGEMDPKMRGEADISVGYKNVSKTFHATVYDKFVATEEDFWSIYDHLGYSYKLTEDITLSENTIVHFADTTADPATQPELYQGYGINYDFNGVLDGGGHSITYTGNRLFHWVYGSGTIIRNVTLNASGGFYWGATIAYGIDQSAVVENVTLNVSGYTHFECNHYVGSTWIHVGEGNTFGNGALFATVDNATIKDCTVYADLTGYPDSGNQGIQNYGGIAYLASSGALIDNCKVYSTDGTIEIVRVNNGATVSNSTVSAFEETTYTVEYYLENAQGAFVKDNEKTETLDSYVGFAVSVQPKSLAGYAFDTDNENNVLSGKVLADGALALKLYYNKSNVVFDTETADEFELAVAGGTATKDLAVTVTDDGNTVTSGVNYSALNTDIVSVSDSGTVTALKGGTTTVTVEYGGATKDFTVTVYTKYIANETDWWSIYTDATTLAGWYKLSGDVTLTQSQQEHFPNGHTVNHTFTGLINGGGNTLTYTGARNSRLFHSLTGTIENLTYNAGNGFDYGSAISYQMTDAVIRNLNLTANMISFDVKQNFGFDIIAYGAGILGVYVQRTLIESCEINVTFARDVNLADIYNPIATFAPYVYYSGIGYEIQNSTIKDVTVNSDENIALYENGSGNTVENSKVESPDIVWTEIDSEEDWWAIYANETTLAGNYKFTKDITLTKNSCMDDAYGVENAYANNVVFTGRIDGNGHTLTFEGADGQGTGNNRLFFELDGTIENLTYNAGKGCYWGSTIAFQIKNCAILNNVTVNVTMTTAEVYFAVTAGDYRRQDAAGGLCVYLENSYLGKVTVNLEFDGNGSPDYFEGIAWNCNKSILNNVRVNSHSQLISDTNTDNGLFRICANWTDLINPIVTQLETQA